MEGNLKMQFPLSPRKFWKKIIEKGIIYAFLNIMLTFPFVFLFQSLFFENLSGTGYVILALAIFCVFFSIFLGIYSVYVSYYIKTYYYSDDSDFLTIKKGVFAPTEIHVQYLKIQDVYVDQDIIDRIMGLYDVHISSATVSSGMEAHIDGVDKAGMEGLKTLLLSKVKGAGHGYTTSNTGQTQTMAQSGQINSQNPVSVEPKKVTFSSPISSDVYGLSSEWWLAEFVKMALSAVFFPVAFTTWISFYISDKKSDDLTLLSWNHIFLIWLASLVIYLSYRLIYLYLWKKHYKYNFGDEYIYMRVGVLSISEKNMGYNTIQDVKVNQGIIDRMFGVADIIIENASANFVPQGNQAIPLGANGIVIEGLKVEDARKIAEEMKQAILAKSSNSKGL